LSSTALNLPNFISNNSNYKIKSYILNFTKPNLKSRLEVVSLDEIHFEWTLGPSGLP